MSPRRCDSARSGSSWRDRRSVQSRGSRRSATCSRRAARSMNAGVEVGVVGSEHRAVEPAGELGERRTQRRRVAELAAGQAVHLARADALPRPAQPHERAPLVGDLSADDGDEPDLEDPVASGRQAGRLDVDDREAGECDRCVRHTRQPTPGVSHSSRRPGRTSRRQPASLQRREPAQFRGVRRRGWRRRCARRPSG